LKRQQIHLRKLDSLEELEEAAEASWVQNSLIQGEN
jgi:hypothetical protein